MNMCKLVLVVSFSIVYRLFYQPTKGGIFVFHILIPAIAVLTVIWFVKSYQQGTPDQRKRLVVGFLFAIVFGFVLFMALTGRIHYIAAIVTGLLPFVRRAVPLLRCIPFVRRFVKNVKVEETTKNEGSDSSKAAGSSSSIMTRAQALDVLGLEEGASEEEIVDAHRRLMQKCHPDRGGNDYLAAQLNQAKDKLLS